MKKINSGIVIKNGVYSYNGLNIPLYSGEWSYWAVIRDNWRAVAKSVKEMGIRIVSSCIPWSYHELSSDEYDWNGRTSPQRDLIGFIELLQEEGLYVLLRAGPYINASWPPHGGYPKRIGSLFQHDRLSPELLREGQRYIHTICRDVLVPRQITRGGNIIMLQADNEIYPVVEQLGDELGCYAKTGIFKDWLKKKYQGDINCLNLRWKTSYSSFDDACFYFHEICSDTDRLMAERLIPTYEYRIRYADSFEFIGWYAAEVVRTVAGWMHESGIDIPVSANNWSPLYVDFGKLCEVADIVGFDVYPNLNFTSKRTFKDEWLSHVDIVKMTEANVTNGNVWSAELESGGAFPPSHFRFITLALMARGLKVWNWYLLVFEYDWPYTPINEWGWTNEYYPVFKDTLVLAHRIEPWNLTPLNDVGLVVYKPHRVIDPGNFESVFNTLESANISYSYVDLQLSGPIGQSTLVYSGSEWLAREDMVRLEAHIENGGTLITFSRAPLKDEFGNPSRLPFIPPEGARPVSLPVTVSYRNGSVEIRNAGFIGSKVNFCYFRETTGELLRMTLPLRLPPFESHEDTGGTEAANFTMGYVRSFGKGRIIFIGSNPSPHILRMVLEQEGQAPYTSVDEPLVTASCFRHNDGRILVFVVNRNEYRCHVRVSLNTLRLGIGGQEKIEVLTGDFREAAIEQGFSGSTRHIEAIVNANDVTVLRIKV